MNKKIVLMSVGLFAILAVVASVVAFPASFGLKGPVDDAEKQAIADAVQNNDFEAFKEIVNSNLQNRFDTMVEKYQVHQEVDEAIENGDYAAWKEIMEQNTQRSNPIADKITEDNFYLLKELRDAKESGDTERISEIESELGITKGPRGPQRGMRGPMNPQAEGQ